ncbi:MAG: N-acetylmuramoyl-L-alanine amidase family protein [Clostridia bacterium]
MIAKKRLFCLLLALIMCLSLLPAAAYAEDGEEADLIEIEEAETQPDEILIEETSEEPAEETSEEPAEETSEEPVEAPPEIDADPEVIGSEVAEPMDAVSDYLKKCEKMMDSPGRAKVDNSGGTSLMNMPCSSDTNSNAKELYALANGTKLTTIAVWKNTAGNFWTEVSYDTGTACVHGYVYHPHIRTAYLDDCTYYPCSAQLTANVDTLYVKSLPCSRGTDYWSDDVTTVSRGTKLTASAIYKNTENKYWYKVTVGSYEGYVYSGQVTCSLTGMEKSNFSVSGIQAPKGNRTQGQSLTLKGKVTSSLLAMNKVGCFVYAGDATSGTAKTGAWANASNKMSFEVKGTAADNGCKIGSLAKGTYTYTIKVHLINYYCTDGSTLQNNTSDLVVYTSKFSIATVTYAVTYDANGGTGAPDAQTKEKDVTLTLTTAVPSRANASAGSYTVTLNANGGSVSSTSLSAARTTSYSFVNWNTAANGSGTSYSPGGSYTANAAVTLYAQWSSTVSTSAVYLPTPSRSGYTFKGWSTNSSASTGVTGYYTPNGNVTLYATWQANPYTVNYDANGGTGAPQAQTKYHDTALTLSSTVPTRSNASAGSYTVTLDANGGSVGSTSLSAARTTSYSFKNWNTAANGSGTSYSPGGSYTANAAVTLYAQWNSSTTTAAVTLPTPTRSGYTFKGWATSSTATSGVTGSYTPSGNVTLYATWEKDLLTGWQYIDGKWYYYLDDGTLAVGWQKINGNWFYLDSSGAMQTGWQKINGYWYYFASGGAMQTGWQKIGDYWYYFSTGGAMQTGWQKIGDYWYYFAPGGSMQTGWQKIGDYWYYFSTGGAMQTGWQKINGYWYYLSSGGAMQTGWLKLNGNWYYLEANGKMVADTSLTINGKVYYFNSSGVCLNP